MARQPYPLEALRKLREERAEAQALNLAAQIVRCSSAEAKLREREQARRQHEVSTAETLRGERERLARGGCSGGDLQRAADFEIAARAQGVLLEQSEAEARQALTRERAREQALRDEQAKLEAEAKLVRSHEESFYEHQADLQQKAEEEAALEQWSLRRH